MLIGLVRESVMQCFCHTCRAPLPASGKIFSLGFVRVRVLETRARECLIEIFIPVPIQKLGSCAKSQESSCWH